MKTFDYSLVKDPQYFKDGRMDAHSDHTYYRDGEEAQEKETSFRYDLNGISAYRHISRWKDMMRHSMPMYSIRGKAMKISIRARFRNILTRLQAM